MDSIPVLAASPNAPAIPSVSWLLCAHAANDDLRLALRSCLDQTFGDFEMLVVVNGASADEVSRAVGIWCGGDSRVRIFQTDIRHLTFSLNLGLHHARADLVARMDSDDISLPDRLRRQVTYMRDHPDVVALGTAFDVIDARGRTTRTVHPPLTDAAIRSALLRGNPLCHPTVMLRRSVVLAAGGYLGAGIHAEDYDLWSRLLLDPASRFANLPEVCLGYRLAPTGAARRSRWAYATMAAAQYRNWVLGAGLAWGLAAVLSKVKAGIRSVPVAREP